MRDNISVDEDLEDDDYIDDDGKSIDFLDEDFLPEVEASYELNTGQSAWRRIEQLREMRELNRILQDDVYDSYLDDFDD